MIRAVWVAIGLLLGLLVFPGIAKARGPGGVVETLITGWALFVARVARQITIDWPHVASGAVSLLLFLAGFHFFCRWIYRHRSEDGAPRVWRFSWTASLTGMIALLFVAGMAVVGLEEQTKWLCTADEPMTAERYAGSPLEGENRMRQVGMAAMQGSWRKNSDPRRAGELFDPGVSRDADGRELHSWQTLILFGFNIYLEQIDFAKPWDDPQHAEIFRKPVPFYVNPAIRMPREAASEYAPSHIAGNQYVLGPHAALRADDLRDGTSETFLAGQVAANFQPWGKPGNWRDPGLGINQSPNGFGAPGEGALMILCDGSVRFFANGTDPSVLRAMATPAGGEKVSPDAVQGSAR